MVEETCKVHLGVVVPIPIVEVVAETDWKACVQASYEPVNVIGEAPIVVKLVHETMPEHEAVVVAAPKTEPPPPETRRLDDDGCEVVASPHQVNVVFEPPTAAP